MDKRNDTSFQYGVTDYVLPSSSPWNKLPQECLERIVLHLDLDTATLATLLRVSRACFFLAVPRLYRNPFKRLADILAQYTIQPVPPLRSQSAYVVPKVLKPRISDNGAVWIDDEASQRFLDYKQGLQCDLPLETERREHQLLLTLFATILPELCERHPDISGYFHGILVAQQRVDLDTKKTIQWTTDCYLSHLQVLDLEKVPNRGSKVFNLRLGDCFQPPIAHYGVLDHMQRGLLAKHPDKIRTLRIPAHRLKTFQMAHERTPRDRKRPSRTLRQQQLLEQQQALVHGNTDTTIDSESIDRKNMSLHGQRLLDTTTKPYCFTFHMLSTLRRLEVYNMSENPADWMTLKQVVSTVQCGHSGPQIRDTLRELSVQTQAMLPTKFYSTLALMDRLETLELIVNTGTRGYGCISQMGASQCKSLKVLKIAHLQGFTTDENSFEDLARFKNLEELEVTTNKPNQFRWFAENRRRIEAAAKKQAALQASLPLSPVSPNTPYPYFFFFGSPDDMVPALSKLRHLTLHDTTHDSRSVVDHVCEAFGEQLESLSLVLPMYEPQPRHRALMFQYPFRCLRTLAIRGKALVRLEFEILPKYFPTVETLILRHYPYEIHQYTSPDNDSVVEAIGQLTRLRTLHLEGVWYLNDKQLLAMVGQCLTLRQLGIHSTPQATMGAIQKVATILTERANNGVPGFQSVDPRVGLLRLPPIIF